MADKKKFLLRIDETIYTALEKWAADDFRSINAQIEYLLKDALKKSGRVNNGSDNSETMKTESDKESNRED
ncbi:MAG: Arc family DNA-binding protein [Melioribacter sp.]|nr:Arc family DNA-binding protein [Melioribacter sp.]